MSEQAGRAPGGGGALGKVENWGGGGGRAVLLPRAHE